MPTTAVSAQAVALATTVDKGGGVAAALFTAAHTAEIEQQTVARLTATRPLVPASTQVEMNLTEYLNSVNGQPWTEEQNCWSLTAEIQSRFFDRNLPLVAYPPLGITRHRLLSTHPARNGWQRVDAPAHGAVVLMSKRRTPRIDEHAGVCLFMPHPIIVHTDRPQGVAVEDVMMVEARGWSPEFYLPK